MRIEIKDRDVKMISETRYDTQLLLFAFYLMLKGEEIFYYEEILYNKNSNPILRFVSSLIDEKGKIRRIGLIKYLTTCDRIYIFDIRSKNPVYRDVLLRLAELTRHDGGLEFIKIKFSSKGIFGMFKIFSATPYQADC